MSALQPAIVFVVILNVCLGDYKDARILEYVNERFDDGGYHFRISTSDGQERDETANVVNAVLKVRGFYSYLVNGNTVKQYYEADEAGSMYRNSENPSIPTTLAPFPEKNDYVSGIDIFFKHATASLAGDGLG